MAEALACTCANGGFGGCSCAASGRGDSHPADEEDQADSLASSGSDWGGGLACICANGGFGGCSCAAFVHPASGDSLAAESSAQGQLIPRGCPYRDVRLSAASPSRRSTSSPAAPRPAVNWEHRLAVQRRRDETVQRRPPWIHAISERRLCSGDVRLHRPCASSLPAFTLGSAGDWFQPVHYLLLHWAECVFLRFVFQKWHEAA